jgi:hypothetical protein
MDNRLRRNEICVIGLPRCDFVFASNRSCFIAYGFGTSDLETGILKALLEKEGVQAVEAGGMRAPGENAFCVKICSQIIMSQFCIALLNNDAVDGREVPNANVNMEYGLMLGFNKYVIPFQRAEQRLPFNAAGLDTVKYSNEDFATKAKEAIHEAVRRTTPSGSQEVDINQRIYTYLLTREAMFARVETDSDKAVFDLGVNLGFKLLMTFAGTDYMFLGNFTHLRPEAVLWRLRMLVRSIDARRSSWAARVLHGVMTEKVAKTAEHIFSRFQIWLVVTSDEDRSIIEDAIKTEPAPYATDVRSLSNIEGALRELGGALA